MKSSEANSKHVVVVGGGIIGLSIAFELIERDYHVTLIDPTEPGTRCSSGNAGVLSALSVTPLAMPGAFRSGLKMLMSGDRSLSIPFASLPGAAGWLGRFITASGVERVVEITRALNQLLAFSVERHVDISHRVGASHLIQRTGQLHLYRTADEFRKDARAWQMRRSEGIEWIELDRAGIHELEPALKPAFDIGIFAPKQGMVVNPRKYGAAIEARIRSRGAAIVQDRVVEFMVAGEKVTGAIGQRGTYAADEVIVCAGAWSSQLLRNIGYRVPLEAQRGYHIDVSMPDGILRRPVCLAARKVFLTSMDFGLRAAGLVEFGGLKRGKNPAFFRILADAVGEAFGEDIVSDVEIEQSRTTLWMGHRPCLPDSLPVIGPSARHGNLWFAFGHGHLGLTGAAVTANLVARALSGEPANLDLAPFAIGRFERTGSRFPAIPRSSASELQML